MRGPGEVLGVRQSGLMDFRVADLLRDQSLIEGVSEHAKRIVQQHPAVSDQLIERWLQHTLQFAQV